MKIGSVRAGTRVSGGTSAFSRPGRSRLGSILAVLVMGILLGCSQGGAGTAGSNETVLQIEGMTCGNCEAAVRTELEALQGVEVISVDAAEDRAVVTIEPDKVSDEDLRIAVAKAGKRLTGSTSPQE